MGTRSNHRTLFDQGMNTNIFGRWVTLLLGIFVAWVVHLATFAIGSNLLQHGRMNVEYRFGQQQAMLASSLQRSLAIAIDLSCGLAIFTLLLGLQLWNSGSQLTVCTQNGLCDSLLAYEVAINGGLRHGLDVFNAQLRRAVNITSECIRSPGSRCLYSALAICHQWNFLRFDCL